MWILILFKIPASAARVTTKATTKKANHFMLALNKSLCQRLWSFISTGQHDSLSVSSDFFIARTFSRLSDIAWYIQALLDRVTTDQNTAHKWKQTGVEFFLSVFIGFSQKQLTCTLVFCDVVFNMFLVWDEMFKRVTSRWTASADYLREVSWEEFEIILIQSSRGNCVGARQSN